MSHAIRKAEGRISETAIDDEIVVMSLDSGDFFSLTGTSRAIWQLIDGTRDRAALAAELGKLYDAPAPQLAGGVDAFIQTLLDAQLLDHG
jgi:pyrroloquinoline quinone biosynthesis protein D